MLDQRKLRYTLEIYTLYGIIMYEEWYNIPKKFGFVNNMASEIENEEILHFYSNH